MRSLMIAAALCAAVCMSAPAQAAASKMTDVQIYCMFMPMATKCAPAAPAKVVAPKPAKVAMVAKPAAAKTGIKMMSCVPAAKGKAYLYECVWK